MMTKKDFISLADHIKTMPYAIALSKAQLNMLADFCHSQNSAFKRERWLGYIRGENGPNGGKRG